MVVSAPGRGGRGAPDHDVKEPLAGGRPDAAGGVLAHGHSHDARTVYAGTLDIRCPGSKIFELFFPGFGGENDLQIFGAGKESGEWPALVMSKQPNEKSELS